MNDVSACVFSDMRYTLIEMGTADKAHAVFESMMKDLINPPASNGVWNGWMARDIADFERYNDQSSEVDPT